jgi:hypothetical protein
LLRQIKTVVEIREECENAVAVAINPQQAACNGLRYHLVLFLEEMN